MRYLFLLISCVAWGQSNISVMYGTYSGSTAGSTITLNSSASYHGIVFTPAAGSLSVSGFSDYSGSRGTANVDSLVAEIFRVLGSAIGATVTYTDASDVVNLTNHPFSNGDTVKFIGATSLPAGIDADTVYFVCSAASNSFQIDDSAGCGSIVTDFSGSSGTQTVAWYIANSTTFTPSPVTSATWVDFSTFSSHTLIAGQRYAVIIRNTEANPAVDTIRMDYTGPETPTLNTWWQNGPAGSLAGSAARGYTASIVQVSTGYVELSNGEKYGSSFNAISADINARVRGTREVGAKFTTPSNLKYNVSGLGYQIRGVSGTTFPKTFTLKLYSVGASTDTLIDSCTSGIAVSGSNFSIRCNFSSSQVLSSATVYRASISAVGSTGDSSNYAFTNTFQYRSGQEFDIPLSISFSYCSSSCTTTANWTNSTTATAPLILLLDQSTPYASQGSGSNGGAYVVAQ